MFRDWVSISNQILKSLYDTLQHVVEAAQSEKKTEYEYSYRETMMRGGDDFQVVPLSLRLEETPNMYIFLKTSEVALSCRYHFF